MDVTDQGVRGWIDGLLRIGGEPLSLRYGVLRFATMCLRVMNRDRGGVSESSLVVMGGLGFSCSAKDGYLYGR